MFYLKLNNVNQRTELIEFLKINSVISVFHYVPLHSSPAGKVFGCFNGDDVCTTAYSQKLLRLPLYYGMGEERIKVVINKVHNFFS